MILILIFLYAFGLTMILPVLIPTLHLTFFAPFLIFAFYRHSQATCLWLALMCGLIIDLFCAQTRFGIYALNYTLTSYLLYHLKNYFFEDSLTTIPIMTILFTYLSSLLQLSLLYLMNSEAVWSWEWVKVEWIEMPINNALYAIIFFAIISLLFPKRIKKTPNLIKFKGKL